MYYYYFSYLLLFFERFYFRKLIKELLKMFCRLFMLTIDIQYFKIFLFTFHFLFNIF